MGPHTLNNLMWIETQASIQLFVSVKELKCSPITTSLLLVATNSFCVSSVLLFALRFCAEESLTFVVGHSKQHSPFNHSILCSGWVHDH